MRYIQKCRSIYHNLNGKSYIKNINLLSKLSSNEINLDNIVSSKPEIIFPEMWAESKLKVKLLDKEICELKPKATTDQFKCGKCKQRKCTYISVQIRSADEGCTNFITCVNCGHSWREG